VNKRAGWCLILMLAVGIGDVVAEEVLVGGYSVVLVSNAGVVAAAEFAITAKERAMQADDASASLALVSIVSAQQQVVAGLNYRLTLKVKVNGEEREAEVIVWWQSWNEEEPYKLTSWEWK